MAQHHVNAIAAAHVICQLLGQIDRAMLAARAAERHRQVLESALLVIADAGIDQREHAGEVLAHALMLVQVIRDRRVLAGERLEVLFASRIGQAARIEDKSAAMTGVVLAACRDEKKSW